MRKLHLPLAVGFLASIACHHGPVLDTGPKPANVGGTIAGIVSTAGNTPVAGRKVTVIEVDTGARFEATTGLNGGYTIKVPQGTYRIDVELREGERVAKQPRPTRVNMSDLDPHRDIVITPAGQKGQ
jgi:hypothetical protein